jgi:hypothetical protein
MKIETVVEQATNLGDFYLHYRRFDKPGQTYLVGTTEFECPETKVGNKHILSRLTSQTDPCGLPFKTLKAMQKQNTAGKLKMLRELAEQSKTDGNVLVYSWSSDRFRVIPAALVTKLTPLAFVLKN